MEIYITAVPPQNTSSILAYGVETTAYRSLLTPHRTLRKVLPEHSTSSPGFQHLRRLVHPTLLPPPILDLVKEELKDGLLWMFICPTSYAEQDVVSSAIESVLKYTPPIFKIQAPRFAPLTLQQAKRWSDKYWYTSYKRENPFGPHPPIMDRQAISILPWIDRNMFLARKAAMDGAAAGVGCGSGAVICDKAGRVRAVAADARNRNGPLAHAAMRAIRLIAEKRRTEGYIEVPREEEGLTEVEREYVGSVGDEKAGYLCQDLIVCLTHEPCVMCSMAIVHSRVLAVILEKDSKAGAMRADREGAYGMFWREELNWRFVTFQWKPEAEDKAWDEAVGNLEDDTSF